MAGWMGIPDFLREVDQLARDRSDVLDPVAEPVRLLPGENPESLNPDDAEHWAYVYRELSEFTTEVLQTARADAYQSANSPQVQVLDAQLQRFQTRWHFWTHRLGARRRMRAAFPRVSA